MMPAIAALCDRARPLVARLRRRLDSAGVGYAPCLADFGYSGDDPAYRALGSAFTRRCAALVAQHPGHTAALNRLLAAHLLMTFELPRNCVLPASVVALYPGELARIAAQLEDFDEGYFDLDNDPFLKDLAILRHRLIPIGAEFAQPNSGVPRSLLFRAGPRQFLRVARLIGARGRRPFFALHAHPLSLQQFNPQGWIATYHRLAELLLANPQTRGWLSTSWFLDPRLAEISPRLAYLRELPCANGAALFFDHVDASGTSGALATSPTRRRLFDEGRYVPTVYTRIWLRDDVLEWSRRHPAGDAAAPG